MKDDRPDGSSTGIMRVRSAVAPLDPAPDRRLRLYRLLGCDAVLSDDPGETLRRLGRNVTGGRVASPAR
mgnify:CR=1 FL=1